MNIKPNMDSDEFVKYLYDKFNPTVEKLTDGLAEEDAMAGSLYWNLSGKYKGMDFHYIYATPFWEGAETIEVAITNDNGQYMDVAEIPFPYSAITMNAENDARLYIETMRKVMKAIFGLNTL